MMMQQYGGLDDSGSALSFSLEPNKTTAGENRSPTAVKSQSSVPQSDAFMQFHAGEAISSSDNGADNGGSLVPSTQVGQLSVLEEKQPDKKSKKRSLSKKMKKLKKLSATVTVWARNPIKKMSKSKAANNPTESETQASPIEATDSAVNSTEKSSAENDTRQDVPRHSESPRHHSSRKTHGDSPRTSMGSHRQSSTDERRSSKSRSEGEDRNRRRDSRSHRGSSRSRRDGQLRSSSRSKSSRNSHRRRHPSTRERGSGDSGEKSGEDGHPSESNPSTSREGPAHLRIYKSKSNSGDRVRSRRSTRSSRPRRTVEETSFEWRREPSAPSSSSKPASSRSPKASADDEAKSAEVSNQREEDRLTAARTIRGRKARPSTSSSSQGVRRVPSTRRPPRSNSGASASTRPSSGSASSPSAATGDEGYISWKREAPRRTRSDSHARRNTSMGGTSSSEKGRRSEGSSNRRRPTRSRSNDLQELSLPTTATSSNSTDVQPQSNEEA